MVQKRFAKLASFALVLSIVAGCGGGAPATNPNNKQQTQDSSENKVVNPFDPNFDPSKYPLAPNPGNPKVPNGAFAPSAAGGKIQLPSSPNQHFAYFYIDPETNDGGNIKMGRVFYGFNSLKTNAFRTAAFWSGNFSGEHVVKQQIFTPDGKLLMESEEASVKGPALTSGSSTRRPASVLTSKNRR